MARSLICLAILVLGAGLARAQPGMVPPAYTYQPQLSDDDRALLDQGELGSVDGGVVALLVGLGVGQAVQGRWHDTGWIFTVGESLTFVTLITGIMELGLPHGPQHCSTQPCDQPMTNNLIIGSLVGYGALHLWEVIDAFAAPAIHNRKVRALRARLAAPYVAPSNGGAVGGVALRF